MLKFEDINKLQICKVMHLYLNSLLRNSFNDMFLRNFALLHHQCKEIFTSFQGHKIFNFLSSKIQNTSSIALFNSKLKSFFLM